MKTHEFDKKFDDGTEDIIGDLDMSTATRSNKDQKRVNVDFPTWVVEALDREAARLGVTRQSIIKVWIAERLEQVDDLALYRDLCAAEEQIARGELSPNDEVIQRLKARLLT